MRKRLWQLLTACMVATLFAPLVQMGAVSADGSISANSYSLKYALGQGMTVGPDGSFWYGQRDSFSSSSVCTISPDALASNVGTGSCYSVPGYQVTDPATGNTSTYGPRNVPHLISGPDGNVWFATEYAIGRVTPTGTMLTPYVLGGGQAILTDIALGPDGNVWFAESNSTVGTGVVGYVTSAGVVTTYDLPSGTQPDQIAAGPDGSLWFAVGTPSFSSTTIGRVTTAGQVTLFPVPAEYADYPAIYLTAGSDGNIWFTSENESGDSITQYIDKITPDGVVSGYSLPMQTYVQPTGTPSGDLSSIYLNTNIAGITSGPDGNIWYTFDAQPWEPGAGYTSYVGNVTPSGTVTQYSTPSFNGTLGPILVGPDNNLWASTDQSEINRISVLVDRTGPTINVTAPAANSAVSGTVTVSGTITEPDQIQDGQVVVHLRAVKSNGKLDGFLNTLYAPVNSDGTWSATFDSTAFADGQYGVTVLANDTAGNSQTATGGASIKPFTIDNTKPTVSFTAPASFASSYAAGPTVAISAADSGSGLAVMAIHVYTSSNQLLNVCGSANSTQLAAGSMSCDLSGLAPGSYYIKAGATDKAGKNTTVASPTFTITG